MKAFVVIVTLLIVSALMTGCAGKGEVIEVPVITFDGNDCAVTGPAGLPAGEHAIVFIDRSDMNGEELLVHLDDGKTIQDLLDLQSYPSHWYPKPTWAHYDSRISRETEETEEGRVDTSTYDLNQVGEHIIICYVGYEQNLWFAAPLFIMEK